MFNNIQKYQQAFNSLIQRLKSKDSILAVMVFGSIITGDLWEESDIDLFVITKDNLKDIVNIYTEEKGISVHIKLISKERLLKFHKEELAGGFIHRIFISSRLVFSKDSEVTAKYDLGRYYPDIDREKWNMVYLGDLLKGISMCKKYLANNSIYLGYISAIKSMEDFSKLYINSSGYMVSKDVTTMAMNLNDNFKDQVDNLFFQDRKDIHKYINDIVCFFEENIDENLKKYTNLLLSFMREKDCFLSSEDIKNNEFFKNYQIDFESILTKLWENRIIKKDNREYKDDFNNVLFKEKVYFV